MHSQCSNSCIFTMGKYFNASLYVTLFWHIMIKTCCYRRLWGCHKPGIQAFLHLISHPNGSPKITLNRLRKVPASLHTIFPSFTIRMESLLSATAQPTRVHCSILQWPYPSSDYTSVGLSAATSSYPPLAAQQRQSVESYSGGNILLFNIRN